MKKQPLLIIVICFILGIFFREYFYLNDLQVKITFFSVLLLALLCYFTFLLFKRLQIIIVTILFFGLGIIFHSINKTTVFDSLNGNHNVEFIFTVDKKLNSTADYKRYEVVGGFNNHKSSILLFIPRSHQDLDFKHYYKVKAYVNKVKEPEFDFQFNYAQFLERRNIGLIAYSKGNLKYALKPEISFNDWVKQIRWNILQTIDHSILSSSTKEFLKGIILSDRTEIDENTSKDFNRSGLIHFLAISGTHIVIIYGLLYWLLMRFSPLSFRKYAIVVSILLIWSFALLIGFGNSVVRSCIMLTVYYVYVLLQRKPDILHALSLSAFIILIIDTQQLFDIGFQLSFLAVLGIFWLNQPILKYFPVQDTLFKKIVFNTISISISAQLATFPLVLFYFHQFSIVSIFANFFIVPLSEFIIVFSFLITLLFWIGLPIESLLRIYDFTIQVLLKIVHWFASWDELYLDKISIDIIEMIVVFYLLFRLRYLIQKFNSTNLYPLSVGFFLIIILRVSLLIFYSNKDELLIFHYKNSCIVSAKFGQNVRFYVSQEADLRKINQYIIEPYITSKRVNNVEVKILPKGCKKVSFMGKNYALN